VKVTDLVLFQTHLSVKLIILFVDELKKAEKRHTSIIIISIDIHKII